jgi:hypothetical protein
MWGDDTSTKIMEKFSSEEEIPRRQDKPLKKPQKALNKKLKTKE